MATRFRARHSELLTEHEKETTVYTTSFFARDQRAFKLVPKSIKEEEWKGEGERGREREKERKQNMEKGKEE